MSYSKEAFHRFEQRQVMLPVRVAPDIRMYAEISEIIKELNTLSVAYLNLEKNFDSIRYRMERLLENCDEEEFRRKN